MGRKTNRRGAQIVAFGGAHAELSLRTVWRWSAARLRLPCCSRFPRQTCARTVPVAAAYQCVASGRHRRPLAVSPRYYAEPELPPLMNPRIAYRRAADISPSCHRGQSHAFARMQLAGLIDRRQECNQGNGAGQDCGRAWTTIRSPKRRPVPFLESPVFCRWRCVDHSRSRPCLSSARRQLSRRRLIR